VIQANGVIYYSA